MHRGAQAHDSTHHHLHPLYSHYAYRRSPFTTTNAIQMFICAGAQKRPAFVTTVCVCVRVCVCVCVRVCVCVCRGSSKARVHHHCVWMRSPLIHHLPQHILILLFVQVLIKGPRSSPSCPTQSLTLTLRSSCKITKGVHPAPRFARNMVSVGMLCLVGLLCQWSCCVSGDAVSCGDAVSSGDAVSVGLPCLVGMLCQ